MLFSTKPDSKGKEAAIFRSRQLTEFRWTPLADIPTFTKQVRRAKLPAGVEQQGMIYSSTETNDKFITENVSFETLLSAIANPDSALYHKDLNGHGRSWAYFGIVCNGLVRYALDIKPRYSTKRWNTVPGMHKIADAGTFTVEQLQLCDVLNEDDKVKHVVLVTDILRDEDGVIRQIEISEATCPLCIRNRYDVEAFYEKYCRLDLWRYDYVDTVNMPDMEQDACLRRGVPSLPVIAVDYGNKSNYRTCEDVVISSFLDDDNVVEIFQGETLIETLNFAGRGKVSRRFARGYYKVLHKASGEMVEFCVTEPIISHSVKDGKITVTAASGDPDSCILYMDFRERSKGEGLQVSREDADSGKAIFYSTDAATLSKVEALTEEEKKTGVITREIPDDAVNFKVYFANKYGVWTHRMIRI